MSNTAGIFSASHRNFRGGTWQWRENEFLDANGVSVAHVRSDVMNAGKESLLLEKSLAPNRIRLRGTTSKGELFSLTNTGFGVSRLEIVCAQRAYTATRVSPFRKERVIYSADGTVARTRPNGRELDVIDEPEYADAPTLDVVFTTWGCLLLDVPWHTTKA